MASVTDILKELKEAAAKAPSIFVFDAPSSTGKSKAAQELASILMHETTHTDPAAKDKRAPDMSKLMGHPDGYKGFDSKDWEKEYKTSPSLAERFKPVAMMPLGRNAWEKIAGRLAAKHFRDDSLSKENEAMLGAAVYEMAMARGYDVEKGARDLTRAIDALFNGGMSPEEEEKLAAFSPVLAAKTSSAHGDRLASSFRGGVDVAPMKTLRLSPGATMKNRFVVTGGSRMNIGMLDMSGSMSGDIDKKAADHKKMMEELFKDAARTSSGETQWMPEDYVIIPTANGGAKDFGDLGKINKIFDDIDRNKLRGQFGQSVTARHWNDLFNGPSLFDEVARTRAEEVAESFRQGTSSATTVSRPLTFRRGFINF